jgi:type VI secretion system secreted protein Hcp
MAVTTFAKIGAIKGESRDARHKDEIEVLSWSWGLSQSGSVAQGGGGGAGKASVHNLTFTHHLDKASPLLMRTCATGEHVKDATVTVRRAGRGAQDYLVIKLADVLVVDVSVNAGDTGDTLESVALAFGQIDLEYKPQKPDGSLDAAVRFAFDVKTNKAG